jgi:hypothetical protein
LSDYVEDHVFAALLLRRSVCGGSREVDPLENFPAIIVVDQTLIIDLIVSGAIPKVRPDVGEGPIEPPLDLLVSSQQLVHAQLLVLFLSRLIQ